MGIHELIWCVSDIIQLYVLLLHFELCINCMDAVLESIIVNQERDDKKMKQNFFFISFGYEAAS